MAEQMSLFEASYEKPEHLPKHIRLIEFFAGIGAQAKALEILNADFEHWRTCEWSWQSIIAYNAIHIKTTEDYSKPFSYEEILNAIRGVSHDYNQPMTDKQLRAKGEEWARKVYNAMVGNNNFCPDISKLHAEDLDIEDKENNTYILTYSFPCVLPGEKVKTTRGYKKIEEVNEGDMVLTHEGRYKRVSMLMQKMASEYYSIKAVGAANLRLTANHPLYILRDNKLEWVQVADLKKGDYLVYNINQKAEDTELDNATLWLLGRYAADGLINPRHYNSVAFAVGLGKEAEFDFKAPAEYRNRWKIYHKSCDEYRIADKRLQDLCAQFGSGAKNKRIPQWVIDLPKDKLQSFFDGYIAGDGHIRKHGTGTQVMFCTVSENLFLGLEEIVMKLYGIIPSVSIRKDNRKETFNDTYNAQFTLERQLFQKTDGRYAYALVKKTELIEQKTPVFNLMVDGDNSYTVQNVIVHNCQDLSNAGLMKGMEKGSGTRSGLLWEVERILLECKESDCLPQVLIMENVPGVVGSGNLGPFNEWLDALERMGYTNYHKILNSKDYGIPQNRRRCFMVSILGQYSYSFPRKTKLRFVLKDFIENDVDEYYYLSDELVKSFELHAERQREKGNGFGFEPTDGQGIAHAILTRAGERPCDNFVKCELLGNVDAPKFNEMTSRVYSPSGISPTIRTFCGGGHETKIAEVALVGGLGDKKSNNGSQWYEQDRIYDSAGLTSAIPAEKSFHPYYAEDKHMGNLRIRKLTEGECMRLMGFEKKDTEACKAVGLSRANVYHQAGDSIVTTVLVGIFGELLGADYGSAIERYAERLHGETGR